MSGWEVVAAFAFGSQSSNSAVCFVARNVLKDRNPECLANDITWALFEGFGATNYEIHPCAEC